MKQKPPNKLKVGMEDRINKTLDQLRSRKAYYYFLSHLEKPAEQKELNLQYIMKYLERIETVLPKVKALVKRFRNFVPHIWDQTPYAAAYLLIAKAFSCLESVVILVKSGRSLEMVEIGRSGQEALDLVFLFLTENDGKQLRRWFSGKTVKNRFAREAFESLNKAVSLVNQNESLEVSIPDVKGDVYGIYSLYSHNCYSALLETIDVFHEDVDFERIAGFHYARQRLHLVESLSVSLLVQLKMIFLNKQDFEGIDLVDNLLAEIGHQNMTPQEIIVAMNDYITEK